MRSATFSRDGRSRPLPEDSSHSAPRRPRHRFLTSTRGLELNGFATSGLGERGYPWRALGERQHELPTRYVLVPIGYTLGRYCTRERSISFSRLCVVVVLRANGGTIPENPCSRWRGGNRGATVLVLGLLEHLSSSHFVRPETIIWTFGKWTEGGPRHVPKH